MSPRVPCFRHLAWLAPLLIVGALTIVHRPGRSPSFRLVPGGVQYLGSAEGFAIRFTPTKWGFFHMSAPNVPGLAFDWVSVGPVQLYRAPTNTVFK